MAVWLARAARVSGAAILEPACLLALLSELGRGELLCSDTSCWDDAVMAQRREQRMSCRLRRADHIAVVNAVVGAPHGVGGHLVVRERARSRDKHEKRRSGDLPIVAPLSWLAGEWLTTGSSTATAGPWTCDAVDRCRTHAPPAARRRVGTMHQRAAFESLALRRVSYCKWPP